jgi:hypothetical protein
MFQKIAYIHGMMMALVRAVKSINLIVQVERRWRLKRRELMGKILIHLLLLLMILIEWGFIVPEV